MNVINCGFMSLIVVLIFGNLCVLIEVRVFVKMSKKYLVLFSKI